MNTAHNSKKRIITLIELVMGSCICVGFSLFRKVHYWAPEKGEYGTRKIPYIEILKENPKEVKEYILVFITIALIGLIFIFLKKRFIKDWLK